MYTRLFWATSILIVLLLIFMLAACGPGFVHFDFTVCSPGADMTTTKTTNNGATTVTASQAPPPCPITAFTP